MFLWFIVSWFLYFISAQELFINEFDSSLSAIASTSNNHAPDPTFSIYTYSTKRMHYDIITPNHVIHVWNQNCSFNEQIDISLWASLIQPGDVIVDLNAGFGWNFVVLANLVGPTGLAFGFEASEEMKNIIIHNVQRNNLWNHTLILHNPLSQLKKEHKYMIHHLIESSNENYLKCVDFLYFQRLLEDDEHSVFLWQDSLQTIMTCWPTIYFDVLVTPEILSLLKGVFSFPYMFFMYSEYNSCESLEFKRLRFLLVHPNRQSLLTAVDLTHFIQMPSYEIFYQILQTNQIISWDVSNPYPKGISLSIPIPNQHILPPQLLRDITLDSITKESFIHLNMQLDPFPLSILTIQSYFQCQDIFDSIFLPLFATNDASSYDLRFQYINNCTLFAREEIEIKHKFHMARFNSTVNYQEKHQEDSNSDEILTWSAVNPVEYAFYELPPPFTLDSSSSQWFERSPIGFLYYSELCGEPIWCKHTIEFQKRIYAWQHPSYVIESPYPTYFSEPRSCATSRFLLFSPPSDAHGIGSIFQVIASTLRYAICLDRILIYENPNQRGSFLKWRHPGCNGPMLECFFEPLSECELSAEDYANAKEISDYSFDQFPNNRVKVLKLTSMPLEGKCSICNSPWVDDSPFFEGLFMAGITTHTEAIDNSTPYYRIFTERSKLTWISQLVRYLTRPRKWFANALDDAIHHTMYSPLLPDNENLALNSSFLSLDSFPKRFLSLHIRHGMKWVEVDPEPVSKYMNFIGKKYPTIKDIFVSTETEELIQLLVDEYPDYRFHYLKYERSLFLDLPFASGHNNGVTDFVYEFLLSMANMRVAIEADAFVGTLTSSWCIVLHNLERTRGDGGWDYHSMDAGSAFSACF